jgi:type IV secretory pathway VirB2 component (pilin)
MGDIIKKFMNKKVLAIMLVVAFIATPMLAMAATDLTGLEADAGTIGLGDAGIKDIINNIISVVLGFLGLIAVILILIGGFMWMTAGGSEEKVKKGRQYIINGVIGLIIILAAYAIATFVISNIGVATGIGE